MAKRKAKEESPKGMLECIIDAMEDKKAERIVIMDLSEIESRIADQFIVCSGSSGIQVEAIAENVERKLKETAGLRPFHREGYENAEWILLDYFDVIVHVFNETARDFYEIEKLWADAVINYHD
ncbi:MAG: ribosome silencing factor [Bacteroidetes bacterium]|nr:ribosome silencing factor [Bacteroidota bacterium]MBU1717836.1 ribosome silencing factor [Bacteroidota bacterium]